MPYIYTHTCILCLIIFFRNSLLRLNAGKENKQTHNFFYPACFKQMNNREEFVNFESCPNKCSSGPPGPDGGGGDGISFGSDLLIM